MRNQEKTFLLDSLAFFWSLLIINIPGEENNHSIQEERERWWVEKDFLTEDIKEADWRSTQKKHYLQHKESGDYH